MMIAANHPNSFLDGIICDVLFEQPIWSLARGDAFKSKFSIKMLPRLKMLPVYRIREGVENLENNYDTFDSCIKLFRRKGCVLIFSEGLCVNEWHLRPLKKGTARLAFKAWEENIPLKVLPVGLNYSSFKKFGKRLIVHNGNFIEAKDFSEAKTDGEKYTLFNKKLKQELQPLVFEIDKTDTETLENKFGKTGVITKCITAPFAFAGLVLHTPIYQLAKFFALKFDKDKVHYDAITFGVLLLSYPFYLLVCFLFACIWLPFGWSLLVFILLPFMAYCLAKFEVRKG